MDEKVQCNENENLFSGVVITRHNTSDDRHLVLSTSDL